MSDDEGVTPFEVARDATPGSVTPAAGKGALGTWRPQDGPRTQSRGGTRSSTRSRRYEGRACERTVGGRGVCESALEPHDRREGSQGKAGVRTGLGKTDRPGSQGGLGKRDHGGTGNPPRNRKSGTGNPPPTVRALQIYPDYVGKGAGEPSARVSAIRVAAAVTCPRAMPPSFGGTRWWVRTSKPSAARRSRRSSTAILSSSRLGTCLTTCAQRKQEERSPLKCSHEGCCPLITISNASAASQCR